VSSGRQYLERRHNAWHVVVEIPKALRPKAGRKRFKKSLGTDSLAEANRLKWAHVTEFKRRIEGLAKGTEANEDAALFRDALDQRKVLEQASDVPQDELDDYHGYSPREHVLDDIRETARGIEGKRDPETARRYFKVATGAATFIRDASTSWLAERVGSVRPSVIDQQRAAINRYLEWAGEHTTVEETNRRRAGAYVTFLRSPASGLMISTARRHVSALSTLWRWLIDRGWTESNPWRSDAGGRRWPKENKTRSALTDAALVALLTGTPDPRSRYRDTLHDLIRLALVSGARLEELCGLRCEDVERRKDGRWLLIREYPGHQLKSPAARREVPLHDNAAHVVERRKSDAERFLFPRLTPGGPDQRRSWNVSRAFSAYRKRVGVKGRGEVFHSLRSTFVEHMEGAGVPESTVKLLVGHARPSLTFGRYSEGLLVDLRQAIDRLSYSDEVSRLIAGEKANGRRPEQLPEKTTTQQRGGGEPSSGRP
jgi:integrase